MMLWLGTAGPNILCQQQQQQQQQGQKKTQLQK
jgi:hypothetical protein